MAFDKNRVFSLSAGADSRSLASTAPIAHRSWCHGIRRQFSGDNRSEIAWKHAISVDRVAEYDNRRRF